MESCETIVWVADSDFSRAAIAFQIGSAIPSRCWGHRVKCWLDISFRLKSDLSPSPLTDLSSTCLALEEKVFL